MEAFFRNDQEIREWVDLFIEKLLTVNLLAGTEADVEFYQGRQAVEKIASSFQEMFDLPKEVLVDGIRQLVEQRLPDHRVIDNFPDFYRLMNDMIYAGLQNVGTIKEEYFPKQISSLKNRVNSEGFSGPSSKVSLNGGGVLTKEWDSSFSFRQHLLKAMDTPQIPSCSLEDKAEDSSVDTELSEEPHHNPTPISKSLHELIDESMKQLLQESHSEIDQYSLKYAQDPFEEPTLDKSAYDLNTSSSVERTERTIIEKTEEKVGEPRKIVTEEPEEVLEEAVPALTFVPVRDPFRFNKRKKNDSNDVPDILLQTPKPLLIPQQIPLNGNALAFVLKQLYGEVLIQWNVTIDEHNFFAKVNNLLVQVIPNEANLSNQEYQVINDKMKKSGFNVFICHQEDLEFPRRLERGIRRICR